MKSAFLLFSLAAIAAAASAQTHTSAPTTAAAKPSTATTTSKASTAAATPGPWIKLPAGVPRVVHGPVKVGLALRYEDIKVGTGPEGEAGKMWHIKYTGWRAADGIKFDSWDDHKQPVIGKDGKLELGPDGKPKLGDPEPMAFPQGVGRLIPGFDYAVSGMRLGGKRRIFIPWQLAYGTRNIPDRPDHPGIPAKSDLIFDVELVEVTDMPEPPQRPVMPVRPMPMPPHPGAPGTAPAPGSPSTPPAPGSAPTPPAPSAAPTTVQPAAPATPPATTTPPTPK
ncbi:MAG: FKBP-type peptidyl-prolyl cis-trans isomerase [Terracidiphilus sp.]